MAPRSSILGFFHFFIFCLPSLFISLLKHICLRLEPFLELTLCHLTSRDQPAHNYAKLNIFRLRHENDCWSFRFFFHSVKFKVKWVKLNGELQNVLFLCNYQMFYPRPSPTFNWKSYSSLKTNNFEKPRLIP